MQIRSPRFGIQADAASNEPVLLVRLYGPRTTKYLASRAGKYGGVDYSEHITAALTFSIGFDSLGRAQRSSGRLLIANQDDLSGNRFSDALVQEQFDNAEIQVDQAFDGLPLGDTLRVFKGIVQLPEDDFFDDEAVRLDLLDEGNARADLDRLSPGRLHVQIGTLIDLTLFPTAAPGVVGRSQPVIYGSVKQAPCYPIEAGAWGRLEADITSISTSLSIDDDVQFANFPDTGTLQIDGEQITYTTKTPATRTFAGPLGRGANGTAAAAHTAKRAVWQLPASYKYLVADHACKAVSNVMVDGIIVPASYYTLSLTGPTTVTFTTKPRKVASLWGVANTDSHTHGTGVIAGTPGIGVSAAEVEVGNDVRCDVEGYADDGGGTYTGTASALITNPADQIKHLIAVRLSASIGVYADDTSFVKVREEFAAAGIRADWGLYDQVFSSELFDRLRYAVAARLFLNAEGRFKIATLPVSAAAVKTLTENDDVLHPETGGRPVQIGRTRLSELFNRVVHRYNKDFVTGEWRGSKTVSDAGSQAQYRMTRTLALDNEFVRDDAAALAIANRYLLWHKDQKWRAQMMVAGLPNLHLEPMDVVAVASVGTIRGWTNKPFIIERLDKRLGDPKGLDSIGVTCREL